MMDAGGVIVVRFWRLDSRTWQAAQDGEGDCVGTGGSKAEALADLSARLIARRVGGEG